MTSKKEVIFFLQGAVKQVKNDPSMIKELPSLLTSFLSTGPMPILIADKFSYYNILVNTALPALKGAIDNSLYQILADIIKSNPPIYGGGVGSHISYEMVTHNEDMIALVGKFIEYYNS